MESLKGDSEDKEEIQRLTKRLEESRQEAYELRSRLQITERCVQDYEGELETFQQDAYDKEQLHAAAIRQIQEEKSNALKDAEERIENLELERELLSKKLEEVRKEVDAKLDSSEILTRKTEENTALSLELQETLEALSLCTEACNQHKEFITVLQNEKRELTEQVKMLEENLQMYKEYLTVSKAQLSAQAEEFKELQEQLAVTQSELAAVKATPDVQSRGNSLFAEVEDNRQQMAKNYKIMLAKFGYMKKDYASKCSEITRLKKEKSILVDKLEVAEKESKKHYKAFVQNYEIRIKELQMAINDLKNDVKPVFVNGNDDILKYAEQTSENSRKEVMRLREEMETRSALRLNEAAELLKTKGELAEAQTKLRKYYSQIKELKASPTERGDIQLSPTISEYSQGEATPNAETRERIQLTGSRFSTLRKSEEILIEEELLHHKYNPRREDVNIKQSVPDSPYVEERSIIELKKEERKNLKPEEAQEIIECSVPAGPERSPSKEILESLPKLDDIGSSAAPILSPNRSKFLEPERSPSKEVLESLPKLDDNGSSAAPIVSPNRSKLLEPERSPSKEVFESLPKLDDDGFSAAPILSPNRSIFLDPSEENKIISMLDISLSSPCTLEKKNNSPRPLGIRQSDNKVGLSPDKKPALDTEFDAGMPPFVDGTCGEATHSILKKRLSISAFENDVENIRRAVRFDDEEKEKLNLVTENLDVSPAKDETDKSCSLTVEKKEEEENRPPRRRPRPKQNQPIIYMF